MFDLPVNEPVPESLKSQIYSRETTQSVYNTLIEEGVEQSKRHRTIILDATYADPDHRGEARLGLRAAAVEPIFIYVTAGEKEIRRRLALRDKAEKVISDAREKDYDMLVARYPEPNPANYPDNLIRIDTTGSREELPEKLIRGLLSRME